jgi:hypothetical protein
MGKPEYHWNTCDKNGTNYNKKLNQVGALTVISVQLEGLG